ncbi:MAG TPA: lipoyl(octanoyl) transferase LipB [Gemmataceae bacterium]|jgi:lipoyl(octanoyl) transferase|nr:lipoyl(octanoyl) transferase LipB [Gemmataceae bacterium]
MLAGSNQSSKITLQIYPLGIVDFEEMLALQRRLVFEVSGDRSQGVLIICEHKPIITVGRQGSRTHIHFDPRELQLRDWPIRWVNRGGGCLLHLPGQWSIYPILPLDTLQLGLQQYLERLQHILLETARDCMVREAVVLPGQLGVWASQRLLAHVGVAVRDWVSYFGAALNVNADLEFFRKVHCGGSTLPMTSLIRERHLAVNPEVARQFLIDRFLEQFPCERVIMGEGLPALPASVEFARNGQGVGLLKDHSNAVIAVSD